MLERGSTHDRCRRNGAVRVALGRCRINRRVSHGEFLPIPKLSSRTATAKNETVFHGDPRNAGSAKIGAMGINE